MYGGPIRPSPDGQKAAFVMHDTKDGSWNTWILDLRGHQLTRLTSESSNGASPVWSPDGTEVAYATNRLGVNSIFSIPASGIGQAKPLIRRMITPTFQPRGHPTGNTLPLFANLKTIRTSAVFGSPQHLMARSRISW
jgi:TolB protein